MCETPTQYGPFISGTHTEEPQAHAKVLRVSLALHSGAHEISGIEAQVLEGAKQYTGEETVSFVLQAPAEPHTQLNVDLCGKEPSVKSHTGPMTDLSCETKAVRLSLHWLNGA